VRPAEIWCHSILKCYNLTIVNTVYLLTFALALVPVLSQMVVTAFMYQGIAQGFRPREARTTPLWRPFLLSGIAFVFTLWHSAHTVDVFFPDYNAADFEHKDILGVSVPLELADKVQSAVSALPFMLLSLFIIGLYFWILFAPRQALVKAKAPVWLLKPLVAAAIVFFVWTSWAEWGKFVRDVQAFF
jgi:hypothetical protein